MLFRDDTSEQVMSQKDFVGSIQDELYLQVLNFNVLFLKKRTKKQTISVGFFCVCAKFRL